jgi:hypothetical protein
MKIKSFFLRLLFSITPWGLAAINAVRIVNDVKSKRSSIYEVKEKYSNAVFLVIDNMYDSYIGNENTYSLKKLNILLDHFIHNSSLNRFWSEFAARLYVAIYGQPVNSSDASAFVDYIYRNKINQ